MEALGKKFRPETVKEYFDSEEESVFVVRALEIESHISATEVTAPKVRLVNPNSEVKGLSKAVEVVLSIAELVSAKAKPFTRLVLAETYNSIEEIIKKTEFGSGITVEVAQPVEVETDKDSKYFLIDIDRFLQYVVHLKIQFAEDPLTAGLKDIVRLLLWTVLSRRCFHWAPRTSLLGARPKTTLAVEGKPGFLTTREAQEFLAEKSDQTLRSRVAATAKVSPKAVILHPELLNKGDCESLSVILAECLETLVALKISESSNPSSEEFAECVAQIARILPAEQSIPKNQPAVVATSTKSIDIGLKSEIVVDLCKLRKIFQEVQEVAPAGDVDVQSTPLVVRLVLSLLSFHSVQQLDRNDPRPETIAQELNLQSPRTTAPQTPQKSKLRLDVGTEKISNLSNSQHTTPRFSPPPPILPPKPIKTPVNSTPVRHISSTQLYENLPYPHIYDSIDDFSSENSLNMQHSRRQENSPPRRGHQGQNPHHGGAQTSSTFRNSRHEPRPPKLPLPQYRLCVDLRDFIEQFEDRMDHYNCTSYEKVIYLEDSIRGTELEPFLRRYISEYGRRCSWSSLVRRIIETFENPLEEEIKIEKMESRKYLPGESVQKYIQDKLDLISRAMAGTSEHRQVSLIVKGLPADWSQYLRGRYFESVRQLTLALVTLQASMESDSARVSFSSGVKAGESIQDLKDIIKSTVSQELTSAVAAININAVGANRETARSTTPYRQRSRDSGDSKRSRSRSNSRSRTHANYVSSSHQSRSRDRRDSSRDRYPSKERGSRDRRPESGYRERQRGYENRSWSGGRSRERNDPDRSRGRSQERHAPDCMCRRCRPHASDCMCPRCLPHGEGCICQKCTKSKNLAA